MISRDEVAQCLAYDPETGTATLIVKGRRR